MDTRYAQAADRSLLVVLATFLFVWLAWVVLPLSDGGVTRDRAAVMAGAALGFVVLVHVMRLVARPGRTVKRGPLAGLGSADVLAVTRAVRKGEAVSEARLAAPAVAYADQLVRLQSISRLFVPVIAAMSAIDLVVSPPDGAVRTAQAVVRFAFFTILAVTTVVGYRRAKASAERNLRI